MRIIVTMQLLIIKSFKIWIAFDTKLTILKSKKGKYRIWATYFNLQTWEIIHFFFNFLNEVFEVLVLKLGKVLCTTYLFKRKITVEMDRTEFKCFLLRMKSLMKQGKCS